MPLVTLTFNAPLNVSCQVGDTAYFVNTEPEGGFQVATDPDGDGIDDITTIGQIREINNRTSNSPTIVCDSNLISSQVNNVTAFIMFSKDNKANLSSILGYFASVKMVNDSTTEAELFSVGLDMFESSK
jgi:hypothetical protein|tara:strand:- start:5810 stop:6196 length:387 start_codon:yes stop_codon:yes gene_type:complete